MNRPRRSFLLRIFVLCLGLGMLGIAPAHSSPAPAAGPDSEVKLVIIVTRHGVRSPLQTNETLGKYAAEPWPDWPVTPGILTPHGRQQMVLMGAYYRARYAAEGLLTGKPDVDSAQVFFRSDNDQRTLETGRALAEGLLPGAAVPDLHPKPAGQTDALFQPVKVAPQLSDRDLAMAAVMGRIGNDPATVVQAYRASFAGLQYVLSGAGGVPPGKTAVLDQPWTMQPGKSDHTVTFAGPLHTAEQVVDALLLEYTEGLPMQEVGWGRMTPAMLTQILKLHSLYFDLVDGTFYPAQAQASNLAEHIRETLEQSASGRAEPGAFGLPGQKFIVVVGHDTNLINLGGLLGLDWMVPGTQTNPVLPGGALVLELRHRARDHQWVVRICYVSQTLEQIRDLTPLTLGSPPALAPIFIPGCSEAGPGYDAPLDKFEALLQRVTDPKFVVPGPP